MGVIASGLILGFVAAFLWGRRPALGIALWLPTFAFAGLATLSLATGMHDGPLLGSLLVSAAVSLSMLVGGCGGVAVGLLVRLLLKIPTTGSISKLYFPTRR